MPTAYTVLFLITIAVAIFTWIIPAGSYQIDPETGNFIAGIYEQIPRQPQGLWDIFMAPIVGMVSDANTGGAIDISLFILFIGGLLGIVNKTGAFDAGVASIIKSRKGKEKSLIPILMIFFAVGGTTFGLAEETLAFFPILIPVMLAVGFDSIVAIAVPLIGSQIGCLASTVNPFSTGVASGMSEISRGEGLFSRIILPIILLAISIWYVYRYASKVEKDPKNSLFYEQREADLAHFKMNIEDIYEEYDFIDALYVPADSELITTLLGAYRDITSDMRPPQVSGGATFARTMKNCVAFGAMFAQTKDTMHQPNEAWPLAEMEQTMVIYAEAIARLCCE